MQINEQKTMLLSSAGTSRLKVAVDGAGREEVAGAEARKFAQDEAARRGFGPGVGGLCENPNIGPIGADGEFVKDNDVLDPNTQISGFRAEFTFAQKI